MKITAQSTFHSCISQNFIVPARPGRYPRLCRDACDSMHDSCGCGWPVYRTVWTSSHNDFVVYAEWADSYHSPNNIIIVVEDKINS